MATDKADERKALESIAKRSDHIEYLDKGKARCLLNGHEFGSVKALEDFLNGKRFRKLTQWYRADYSRYEPYIVESKKSDRQLYCQLTRQLLNKIPSEVEGHAAGRKFQRLKALAEKTSLEEVLKAQRERDAENESDDDVSSVDNSLEADFIPDEDDSAAGPAEVSASSRANPTKAKGANSKKPTRATGSTKRKRDAK